MAQQLLIKTQSNLIQLQILRCLWNQKIISRLSWFAVFFRKGPEAEISKTETEVLPIGIKVWDWDWDSDSEFQILRVRLRPWCFCLHWTLCCFSWELYKVVCMPNQQLALFHHHSSFNFTCFGILTLNSPGHEAFKIDLFFSSFWCW